MAWSEFEVNSCVDQVLIESIDRWLDYSADDSRYDHDTTLAFFVVRMQLYSKLIEQFRKEEVQKINDGANLTLFRQLPKYMLGPDPNEDFVVPNTLTTDQILERVQSTPSEEVNLEPVKSEYPGFTPVLKDLLADAVQLYNNIVNSSNDEYSLERFIIKYSQYLITKFQPSNAELIVPFLKQLQNQYPPSNDSFEDLKSIHSIIKFRLLSQFKLVSKDSLRHQNYKSIVLKLREQGNNLMQNQGYAQAIEVYTKAIQYCDNLDDENIPQLLTNRSIAYMGLFCYPEARSDLNRAVSLDQTFTPAWTQLGYVHLFLGTSLTALKCYLAALQTAVGDILPKSVDPRSLKTFEKEYRQNKMNTIMPQFVQRIIQSMILTEKRAYQQRKDSEVIKSTVANARAILARLRSYALQEDLSYFTYLYEYDDNSFRTTASRANRARPNVLTPDVTQDIIANTGFESTSTTLPAPTNLQTPTNPLDTALDNAVPTGARNAGNPTTASTIFSIGGTNSTEPNNANNRRGLDLGRTNHEENNEARNGDRNDDNNAPNVRNLLNNFGDIFEGSLGNRSEVFPNDPRPEAGTGINRPGTPFRADSPTQAGQQSQANNNNPQQGDQIRNIMRNYLPNGIGQMITQALGSVGGASGNISINGRVFDFQGNPVDQPGTNSAEQELPNGQHLQPRTQASDSRNQSRREDRDDDVDMFESPDLD